MNVLLLIMDSVQARNTSIHDYSHETTPFLSEFSESATTYTQARAPSFFSLPSHASMFSGQHPVEHGVTSKTDSLSEETIFERLSKRGYSTGLFSSNAYLSKDEFGLNRGFTHVFQRANVLAEKYPYSGALNPPEYFSESNGSGNINYLRESLRSDQPIRSLMNGVALKTDGTKFPYNLSQPNESQLLSEKFLEWQNEQTQDWAAVINFMDTHFPYMPNNEHNRWGDEELFEYQKKITNHRVDFLVGEQPWWISRALESLYDGTIHQVDQAISQIYAELSRRGDVEDTLIIVTSDHGEGFGECSRIVPGFRIVAHAAGLHELLTHVPLLVQFPGQTSSTTVDKVSGIRKIYHLIEQVVDGEYDHEILCPEHVLSYAELSDRFEQLSTETSEGNFDYTDLSKEMHAVYENAEDRVNKYVQWGDSKSRIQIRDAQASMLVDTQIETDLIESRYDELEVNTDNTDAELTENTEKHLKDLGYL